jgi:hypothetical protein
MQELDISITKPSKTLINQTIPKKVEVGKVYTIEIEVPQSRQGVRLEIKGRTLEMEEASSDSPRDLFCTISRGRFFDVVNGAKKATCKFIVDPETAEKIISSRSWNQNPMGVSLTICTPDYCFAVPKEPVPVQEGRCPPNPIWTTRFPTLKEIWYPVNSYGTARPQAWSKFMNRYAISPVKPLDTPGSDASGSTFKNSWEIDIPFDGFYGVRGTRDNRGAIYIDGNKVSDLDNFNNENPAIKNVFLTKGRRIIEVEVFNTPQNTVRIVNQKIFRTKDWHTTINATSNSVDVNFGILTSAAAFFVSTFKMQELDISITKPSKTLINQTIPKKVEVGRVYLIEIEVPQSTQGVRLEIKGRTLEMEEASSNSPRDLFCNISRGRFFDVVNGPKKATCKFIVDYNDNVNMVTGGTSKDGVIYEGPPLFHYVNKLWSTFMNSDSVSPFLPPIDQENPEIIGTKTYTWKGVRFPESGQYDISFQSDDDSKLFIGGVEVLSAESFRKSITTFKVNVTQGTYNLVVKCNNLQSFGSIFRFNPVGFALDIRKNVRITNQVSSWKRNPVAISAVLIPPPCPKLIFGKGVVTDVIVNDPGNGYLRPIPQDEGYPVALRLKEVIVEDPGINYDCVEDELRITPSNGAELDYICDPFGKIREVKVLNPGLGFTEYPEIRIISETGVNASFRPVFEIVRDPIVVDPEKLIQVTDLVGLKQTGYVNGRPYYGSVYYDQGVRYAGFYETIGEPVQVYDTLQESITAQITTPPSAIERSGTDIGSNNPRLNIPGTPENLI